MGAYVNFRTGRRDQEEYISLLGINGFNGRNNRGQNLLEIYGSKDLRFENTFYTHNNYTTYMLKDLGKTTRMNGIFSIAQKIHRIIQYCKSFTDGAERDHASVEIKLDITYIKFEHNTVVKGVTGWRNIASD